MHGHILETALPVAPDNAHIRMYLKITFVINNSAES